VKSLEKEPPVPIGWEGRWTLEPGCFHPQVKWKGDTYASGSVRNSKYSSLDIIEDGNGQFAKHCVLHEISDNRQKPESQ
jgi:hypothetical protein